MIAGIASAIGSIFSAINQRNQIKAANAAAQQAASNQGKVVGAETGALNGILQNYFGQGGVGPESQNLIQALMQQYGAGSPQQPGNMRSTGMNQNAPGQQPNQFSSLQNQINALNNYQGLAPEQLNAFQNILGRSGESTINTLSNKLGGVANQNNLIDDLFNQNAQRSADQAIQLAGQGAQGRLGALQSAGELSGGLGSLQNQKNQGILGILGQLFGQGTSVLDSSIPQYGQLAGIFGQQGAQAAQNAASIPNPYSTALTGVGSSLSQLFPGSYGGQTSSPPQTGGLGWGTDPGFTGIQNVPSAAQFGAMSVPSLTSAQNPFRSASSAVRTPSAQGFNGGLGGVQNPNTGGFNGLTGSEMTNPGMAYQSQLGGLGPAKR